MKYVVFSEFKEPIEENMKKMYKIEQGRIERGESFSAQGESVEMYWLLSEPKGIMLVDTDDPAKIVKWASAYGPILKYKISPIMTRTEWEKATQ